MPAVLHVGPRAGGGDAQGDASHPFFCHDLASTWHLAERWLSSRAEGAWGLRVPPTPAPVLKASQLPEARALLRCISYCPRLCPLQRVLRPPRNTDLWGSWCGELISSTHERQRGLTRSSEGGQEVCTQGAVVVVGATAEE